VVLGYRVEVLSCASAVVLGYWAEVWTLCEALWGRLGSSSSNDDDDDLDPDDTESPDEYLQQLERRRAFSAWLSHGAAGLVEEEVGRAGKESHAEAIFSYLTGGRISMACRLAQKHGRPGHRLKKGSRTPTCPRPPHH